MGCTCYIFCITCRIRCQGQRVSEEDHWIWIYWNHSFPHGHNSNHHPTKPGISEAGPWLGSSIPSCWCYCSAHQGSLWTRETSERPLREAETAGIWVYTWRTRCLSECKSNVNCAESQSWLCWNSWIQLSEEVFKGEHEYCLCLWSITSEVLIICANGGNWLWQWQARNTHRTLWKKPQNRKWCYCSCNRWSSM